MKRGYASLRRKLASRDLHYQKETPELRNNSKDTWGVAGFRVSESLNPHKLLKKFDQNLPENDALV